MFIYFYLFITSKSIVSKWLEQVTGYMYSRQYIIKFIIGFTRIFKGLAEAIRLYILKNAITIHCDETSYRCIKIAKGCYIWVLVTGKHEKKQAAIYFPGQGRGNDQFLKSLGLKESDQGEFIVEGDLAISIQNFVTDGHGAHNVGIKMLTNFLKKLYLHALCFVHVRRSFLKALDAFGVLKEYQKAKRQNNFEEFIKKFNEELINSNKEANLLPIVEKIVMATYLLDLILALDTDFVCTSGEEIKNRRNKYSRSLIDQFFNLMDEIYNENKELVNVVNRKDGTVRYTTSTPHPFLKAVIYALNHKEMLYAFLEDGDIETHNNIAELLIRRCVRQRSQMLFLYSTLGYQAYCDAMTIIATVEMCGENTLDYMLWAFDCAKKELFEMWYTAKDNGSSKGLCYFPKNQRDGNGNTIGLYDDNYKCAFDNVHWDYFSAMEI